MSSNDLPYDPKMAYDENSDLIINNNFKLTENLIVKNDIDVYINTIINGSLTIGTNNIPQSKDDEGTEGEIRYNDSFLYIKTSSGWKKSFKRRLKPINQLRLSP